MTKAQQEQVEWHAGIRQDTHALSRAGVVSIGSFVVLFGLWASLVPISAAVVALGSVVPAGQSQVVQHPSGGLVTYIHAVDGQRVEKDEILITLDPVVDQAELARLEDQLAALQAVRARLQAEIDGARQIVFSDTFFFGTGNQKRAASVLYDQLMQDQQGTFTARRQALEQEISGLRRQVDALQQQIRGLNARETSATGQARSLRDQLARIRPLAQAGDFPRNRAEELERQLLQLEGEIDTVRADRTGLMHQIEEIRGRITGTYARMRAETGTELASVRSEITAIENQITAARDVVTKRQVRAPASGVLTNSSVFTNGAVVRPGDVIAEIVPATGHHVETQVAPRDIDNVAIGQLASVTITAFNSRLQDPFEAEVSYVAADAALDEMSGLPYFTVRLTFTEAALISPGFADMRAGMEAQVYISTSKRSFFAYMADPLMDSFRRAFRER